MEFEFISPEKIVFGIGKVDETGELCKELGGNALIVCDEYTRTSGLSERVAGSLKKAGIKSTTYSGVVPNPTVECVDSAGRMAIDPGNDDVVSAFDNFFGNFEFKDILKEKLSASPELVDVLAEDAFTYMKGIAELNPVPATVAEAAGILRKSSGL